jgi:hypothetical protein
MVTDIKATDGPDFYERVEVAKYSGFIDSKFFEGIG